MMFRAATTVVAMFLFAFLSVTVAQVNATDEAAIRVIVSDFKSSWTKCDAKSLAGLWVQDGDFLSPYATFAKGRAEIEKFYADAFASGYCGSNATGTISNIRFVKEDVAIVNGTWDIKGAHDQNGRAVPEEKGLFTAITKKQSGRWLLVAQREMVPATP